MINRSFLRIKPNFILENLADTTLTKGSELAVPVMEQINMKGTTYYSGQNCITWIQKKTSEKPKLRNILKNSKIFKKF